ncbi:MAG: hypothetical protein KDD50_05430 [Bdellovibrionales bacterium]|nr:hypothetical protein [Bdellovibrionales bacterium]
MKVLVIFLGLLYSTSSFATNPEGYTCYDFNSLGGVIDINLRLNQVCSHPGSSVEDCSALNQPYDVIVHSEKGYDNTLIQGYFAVYSESPEGNINYIRIYVKPFLLADRSFVYKASVAGNMRKFEAPDFEVNTVSESEFVCKKWK